MLLLVMVLPSLLTNLCRRYRNMFFECVNEACATYMYCLVRTVVATTVGVMELDTIFSNYDF
jgi:hypothetical protein